MRVGIVTIKKVPPTPMINLLISRLKNEDDNANINVPIETRISPVSPIVFVPYLLTKAPPRMERNTPGNAIKDMRLLALALLTPYTSIRLGNTGGTICIENKKEEEDKRAMESINQRLRSSDNLA